jgi:hypothetical protein
MTRTPTASATPSPSVTRTVTPTISVTPSITPSKTPTISITPSVSPSPQQQAAPAARVQGNQLVDGNNKLLQLRGVNVSALEFYPISQAQVPPGGNAFDYWGGQNPNFHIIEKLGSQCDPCTIK